MRRLSVYATELLNDPIRVRNLLVMVTVGLVLLSILAPGLAIHAEDAVGTGH